VGWASRNKPFLFCRLFGLLVRGLARQGRVLLIFFLLLLMNTTPLTIKGRQSGAVRVAQI
jgi:hypothetical protein